MLQTISFLIIVNLVLSINSSFLFFPLCTQHSSGSVYGFDGISLKVGCYLFSGLVLLIIDDNHFIKGKKKNEKGLDVLEK